jgi:hypothetical protein
MSWNEKEAAIIDKMIDLFSAINLLNEEEKETTKIALMALVSKVFSEQIEKDEKKDSWVI